MSAPSPESMPEHGSQHAQPADADNIAPLADLGRLSDPSLLILASLADGPKHGYAMMEDIAQMAGARLGPGTLYGAIARLEQRQLIEAMPSDERRRPYRLTGLGVRVLREQLTSLEAFAATGLRRLGLALG